MLLLIQGKLSRHPMLTLDGKVHVDTEHAAYYGNSLGGIIGEVYMASTMAVTKGNVTCALSSSN